MLGRRTPTAIRLQRVRLARRVSTPNVLRRLAWIAPAVARTPTGTLRLRARIAAWVSTRLLGRLPALGVRLVALIWITIPVLSARFVTLAALLRHRQARVLTAAPGSLMETLTHLRRALVARSGSSVLLQVQNVLFAQAVQLTLTMTQEPLVLIVPWDVFHRPTLHGVSIASAGQRTWTRTRPHSAHRALLADTQQM